MAVRLRLPLAVATAIVVMAPLLDSCTYDNPPVLELDNRPDAPIEGYAAGRLGIVEPTYAHSHLVVAYRYLSGLPLSPIEQQGVLKLMRVRLGEPEFDRNYVVLTTHPARRLNPNDRTCPPSVGDCGSGRLRSSSAPFRTDVQTM